MTQVLVRGVASARSTFHHLLLSGRDDCKAAVPNRGTADALGTHPIKPSRAVVQANTASGSFAILATVCFHSRVGLKKMTSEPASANNVWPAGT